LQQSRVGREITLKRFSWIGPSRKIYRSERANNILKVYEEIKHPDFVAVRMQI